MRTSKEELIQRGILMPGDTASVTSVSSPLVSSSVLAETASRSSTPRLNLPHLASNNKSGKSSVLFILYIKCASTILCIDGGIVPYPVLKLCLLSNINNGTERPNSANNGPGPQTQTTGSLISLRLQQWPPPVQSFPGQVIIAVISQA